MKTANVEQLASYIRFQLDQLSARNAHHDFENLCRHLARLRICSNIIPATGPVSGGGDQGRDFETFRTYLGSSPIANSTFLGMISQKPIAFACSLQKRGLNNKIKSDVTTILGVGLPVEAIHYFCASDVRVSRRHSLQLWAKQEYSISLEIYDGQAISELLCDHEIFWIAERFLGIPNDVYPRVEEEGSWYSQSFQSWKERGRPDLSYADFHELKSAIRHATFSTEQKPDIPFWIDLLEQFIDDRSLPQLKRKASYEVAVASLRGLGIMYGQEDRLREYFDMIPNLEDPTDLEDAVVLLQYCVVASLENNVQLNTEELTSWRNQLIHKVEERLQSAKTPGTKCPLLDIRGFLALCIDPIQPRHVPSLKDAFRWWTQLIHIVQDAPLFPLERFADRLTDFIRLFEEDAEFSKITQEVDLLLSQRYGNFIAGEKCRDRAMAFHDKGKTLRAIGELHQTKVKWYAEEALHGSLLSMLMISQWYLELGLSFAAKYYSLAAAFIALHADNANVKSLLPRALFKAASCDYYQGSWRGYLELTDIALKTHSYFSDDAGNLAIHEELQNMLFHTRILMSVTERLAPDLLEPIRDTVKKWKAEDWLEELSSAVDETWGDMSIPKLWLTIEEQLGGRPFGDLGPLRKVSWSELGITWAVEWSNDYETTLASEQFIAILQILLADLATVELCLPKTEVWINISAEDLSDTRVEPIPSNTGGRWKVILPTLSKQNDKDKLEHLQITVFSVVSSILANESLLSSSRFYAVLEDCFKNGISMKVFVAKPYEILLKEFVGKDIFESFSRAKKSVPEANREFVVKGNEELEWRGGPGPGYSKKQADEYLANRYSRLMVPIEHTLRRLREDIGFRMVVERLRADGWLDWHILHAIFSIVVNYRVSRHPEACNLDIYNRLFQETMNAPETESSPPVPLGEFTEEALRQHQKLNMVASLKTWGLESHKSTPDLDAIEHFLRSRYNYWTDDIDHSDPFPHP